MKCWPHYVTVKKTGSVSYRIKDQLTSPVVKAHAEHFRVGNILEWTIRTDNKPLRRATLSNWVPSDVFENDSGNERNK